MCMLPTVEVTCCKTIENRFSWHKHRTLCTLRNTHPVLLTPYPGLHRRVISILISIFQTSQNSLHRSLGHETHHDGLFFSMMAWTMRHRHYDHHHYHNKGSLSPSPSPSHIDHENMCTSGQQIQNLQNRLHESRQPENFQPAGVGAARNMWEAELVHCSE